VDDPSRDGWDTEVVNQQAGAQLKKLAKVLSHPKKIDKAHVQPLVTADCACGKLRPDQMSEVFRDGAVVVQRGEQAKSSGDYRGVAGMVDALRSLVEPWPHDATLQVKFKLFTVEASAGAITTRQYVAISGSTAGGSLEQNSTWTCHWMRNGPDDSLRLRKIELEDYEQVTLSSESKTMLADCTEAVLGADSCFSKQFLYGADHWADRVLPADVNSYQGLAIGDVNGDGLDDLYVCQVGGLPNRLLVQNPDGTVTDKSASAGVDWLERTRSALLVDLDEDGDQDLIVATYSALLLMENDGAGKFSLRKEIEDAGNAFSLAATDYDHDGDLDVYVCIYYPQDDEPGLIPYPVPYHDANNGGRNLLLRNDGQLHLVDVTNHIGLDENNSRFSLAACWEDYDNDGDQDLYVANDFGRNNLYCNDRGRFKDVAASAGVEDQSFGMSATWADYNRDGLMDLYVSNMFSAAGNRVTYQRQFKQGASDDAKRQLQYLARGNSLFENTGDGTFRDVSRDAGVMMGRWSWGSLFADLNRDGWEDLLVTNGYLTRQNSGDL